MHNYKNTPPPVGGKSRNRQREEATAQLAQQREEMNRQLYEIRRHIKPARQQRREVIKNFKIAGTRKRKIRWERRTKKWVGKSPRRISKTIHKRFQDLVGRSTNYGIALMDNFLTGIGSQMPALIARMESIAGMIDSYMPHSPAKRGPLSRIMEWGPALVGSLSEGIKKSMPQLEAAMRSLASVPASALAGG